MGVFVRVPGLNSPAAKELKEFRTENTKFKRLDAESELEKLMLKGISKEKF